MKLLGMTEKYGGRVGVQVDYSGQLFFNGEPQPAPKRLIVLDLPGMEPPRHAETSVWFGSGGETLWKRLVAYLTKRAREQTGDTAEATDSGQSAEDAATRKGRKSRREISEMPADLWRPAHLDDFVDAYNANNYLWYVHQHFTLQEIQAFADKWVPELQRRMAAALETPEGRERVNALEKVEPFLMRIQGVVGQNQSRLRVEVQKAKERIDKERLKAARREENVSIERLIEVIGSLRTSEIQSVALNQLAKDLAQPPIDAQRTNAALDLLARKKKLREQLEYNPRFWKAIGAVVRLEPNVTGETIDISEAREETVTLGWDVLRAKRVGPVLPGRSALVVRDKRNGVAKYFIRGERKLKFQAQRAKSGALQKYGCTLTMTPDENRQRMSRFLLDVERLDTLASVDPESAAREAAAGKDLPPDHLIYRVAEAAKTDSRQARVLSDLLIELHVGADADILRAHARAQNRANRRR